MAISCIGSPVYPPVSIPFQAYAFRQKPSPLNVHGIHIHNLNVAIEDFPEELADWTDVNPREATEVGRVPRDIRDSLLSNPFCF